jgi:hypothetical protein
MPVIETGDLSIAFILLESMNSFPEFRNHILRGVFLKHVAANFLFHGVNLPIAIFLLEFTHSTIVSIPFFELTTRSFPNLGSRVLV